MTVVDQMTIEREVLIDAPPEVVWHAITEPTQITQWFADQVDLDLRPGGTGAFVFEKAEAGTVTAPLHVEVVEPPHRFAFRWGHSLGETPGPSNSVLVEFTLAMERHQQTRLRVVETGLALLPWTAEDKNRYLEDHGGGWATHLGRLRELLTATTG